MFGAFVFTTLLLAIATSFAVEKTTRRAISKILNAVVGSDLSGAWGKFVSLSIYVFGLAWGAPVNRLTIYIDPSSAYTKSPTMDTPHLILECYRTVIDTLLGLTEVLMVFFIFMTIAYAIIRVRETRAQKAEQTV